MYPIYMIKLLREGFSVNHRKNQEIITKKIIHLNGQPTSMHNAEIENKIQNLQI